MNRIDEFLNGVRTVAIAGHVNPDGDCVGSCMATYLYLRDNFPEIEADVYLEHFKPEFRFIEEIDNVKSRLMDKDYDLLILLDISSKDRIGVAGSLTEKAGKVLCFDHHVTNREQYTWLINDPQASSASEVVYRFMDPEKISEKCAEAIYMGIVHDTGVFQYSCTSPETMRIAADLMEKGVPFNKIIDRTYYQKTSLQNQLLARTLMESIQMFGGKLIIGYLKNRDINFYGATSTDMDGIVSQLRNTAGVEVAIFMYEKESGVFKVSLRSSEKVDVSAIAQKFGGGGHVRAAGCVMQGSVYDVINNLTLYLERDLV
uniref:DHH family phosphoesterase n=1 Tax=Eubacterium cellulosolvens TaxID=29322 RepID=UPI000487B4A3|nr:bifunctional oligoribonuclease/PAP phosphatase NrnA [[Eubacterium] cellulosolvens]